MYSCKKPKVLVRPAKPDDLENIRKFYADDLYKRQHCDYLCEPLTLTSPDDFIEQLSSTLDCKPKVSLALVVEDAQGFAGFLIGTVNFNRVDLAPIIIRGKNDRTRLINWQYAVQAMTFLAGGEHFDTFIVTDYDEYGWILKELGFTPTPRKTAWIFKADKVDTLFKKFPGGLFFLDGLRTFVTEEQYRELIGECQDAKLAAWDEFLRSPTMQSLHKINCDQYRGDNNTRP